MSDNRPQISYDALIAAIRLEFKKGLARPQEAVNRQRVITYWHAGRHIDKFLSETSGLEVIHLIPIAEKLDSSLDVVRKILKFYRCFPKLPKNPPLSWSQYRALLTAPAARRALLFKRAITEGIGADELYALISLSRSNGKVQAQKPVEKLDYTRGKLYIYKTLQGRHLKLKKGRIMVDCGFHWKHKVKIGPESALTGGHIIRSVKTRDDDYELRHCNEDASSLYTYLAEVARVIDADTFLLTIDVGFSDWLDDRVRLRGIDAPEITTAPGFAEGRSGLLAAEAGGSGRLSHNLILEKIIDKLSMPYNSVYMHAIAVSNKELEAVREIRNSLMHAGRIPSMRELMFSLGYKSPRSASLIVDKLIKKGVLRRKEDGGLQFVKSLGDDTTRAQTVDVPMVGMVSCGAPILAEENIQARIPVSTKLARPPHRYFLLQAKGDSMDQKGIDDGDLVLVRQQTTAKDGDTVVALIDDEATIKEFRIGRETHVFKPRSTNKTHQPVVLTKDFQIQGVVVTAIPKI